MQNKNKQVNLYSALLY